MEDKKQHNKNAKKHKVFKILKIIGIVFFVLFLAIILFIRSSWGQNIIINYATTFVSNKTHTKVEIEKLYITFGGDIKLNGLYLEDTKGDTLIYSKSLEADLPLWPAITGKGIGIEAIEWEGFRANIVRKDSIQGYNFQFLIDAFATADTLTATTTETDSNPMKIIVEDIHLKDFDVDFNDAVLGIASKSKLGVFNLEFDTFDLETMDFKVSEALISNSNITYIQTPVAPSTDTTTTSLPYIDIDDFKIKNLKVNYSAEENGITLNTNISDFYIENASIDLPKDTFIIDAVGLKNSDIAILSSDTATPEPQNEAPSSSPIAWPEMVVKINAIDFANNTVQYLVNQKIPTPNTFNADALVLEDFNLNIKDIYLLDKTAGLNLNTLSFNEGSGLHLKQGQVKVEATDNKLLIEDLKLALNNNLIQGDSRLDYNGISALVNTPETSKVSLKLPHFQVDLKDAYRFQPDLKSNPYLDSLSQKVITGQLYADGYLASIALQNTTLNWGKTTHIATTGLIENATNPDLLSFNISNFKAETSKPDLLKFIDEKTLGINLPEQVTLLAILKGNLNNLETTAKLNTSQGIANLNATYTDNDTLGFTSDLSIEDFKLNELLLNENLGALSLTVKASGSGKNINTLDANLDAMLSSFKLNSYEILNLPIHGDIKNGTGDINSNYKDKNINLELQTHVVLDSISPEINANLNIIGADLLALGLVEKDIRAKLKLNANFKGNADRFNLTSSIDEGTIVYDNKTYLLGDVNAKAYVNTDSTYVSLTNKLLNLELASNANPQTFSNALEQHMSSYFSPDSTLTISKDYTPVHLKFTGKLSEDPILTDIFLPSLKQIDTIDIGINFNESEKILDANILAPHINYGGNTIDSLALTFNTAPDLFKFNFGFNNIHANPIFLKRTEITGQVLNKELNLDMYAYDEEDLLMQLKSKIKKEDNNFILHLLPEDLIINKLAWKIPEDNYASYGTDKLTFNNFNFTKNNQFIAFTNTTTTETNIDNFSIAFENFNLIEFLNYLNPEQELAQGILNGNLTVQNPFSDRGYLANLTINKFNVLNTNFGTLTLQGDSETNAKYNFSLSTKEGDADLDISGVYTASETNSNIDADININTFKTKALEGLSLGELTETSGSFNGQFNINGALNAPQYKGDLVFNKTRFKVTKLNSFFELPNETLNIDNSGISMTNFTINDENNSAFILDGFIDTESLINPKFDLKIKANNFQVLNATKEDNDMLYGFLAFKADGTIKGDLNVPIINIKAGVSPKTNITYVMPSSTVNIEDRDGVVIFVNRDNPDAILTRNQEDMTEVTGFNITANFSIPKEAKATLVIDKNTGDNFTTSGEGKFLFKMETNGRMNLSGVYTVSSGHYEMSLYEIVKRKFELVSGGQVTWSGNPFDANLDIQALYNVETSASALMAAQISGSSSSTQNEFKQTLPFEVYLNVDGELMHPKISFNLDMPEEEQGAVSGQVYGRLQQVNQQEGELNRQVFSLLVMNRFYPESGSDGSSGGFASIARDNLNDAISDQLNMFSDKLLGSSGVELDFGLNSFTDYQGDSSQQRTQLEVAAQKKLFNDRVIVRVGSDVDIEGSSASGEETPLIGDVSLEYLITPSGKYRVKAFQKNEFESVIDGQTTVSGLALIFTKEFNKFKELWSALLNTEKEKTRGKRGRKRKEEIEKPQETTE
ncbi:translocation/assembly module TamB [Formosa sediminum]|uniref:Translocation/assembly module TamB n=1 Tax=Formosa sediminum TaxID=2594004 RepID=A0A516GQ63_9FLAO|nr:translocation/assembly module TamB domain-containing protein [Formosa sediminum]QDO93639.1 translocation/assembly module TamB [Formosa sediminum]